MTSSAREDFKYLLEQMAQGSEDAAWKITEIYTPHIMRVIRKSLPAAIRTKVDSVDFAQAVWASILLKRDRLDQFQEPKQFIGFLATTARHKIIDLHRYYHAQKNDVRIEVPLQTPKHTDSARNVSNGTEGRDLQDNYKNPTPSQVAIYRETWRQLMEKSTDRDREIISLRIEGLANQAIAQRLSVSDKTVQRTLNRLLGTIQS